MTLNELLYLAIGMLIGAMITFLWYYKEYRGFIEELDRLEAEYAGKEK